MSNPYAKGRPRLQRGKDAARVSITLPPAMLRRLRKIAKASGWSLSELIRDYIESAMPHEG